MEQNYVSNVVKNYNPNLNLDHNIKSYQTLILGHKRIISSSTFYKVLNQKVLFYHLPYLFLWRLVSATIAIVLLTK